MLPLYVRSTHRVKGAPPAGTQIRFRIYCPGHPPMLCPTPHPQSFRVAQAFLPVRFAPLSVPAAWTPPPRVPNSERAWTPTAPPNRLIV